MGKDREIAVMVQKKVELDRPFGLAEGCPVEKGRAKVDHGRVETEESVLEAELLLWCNGSALTEKLIEHLLVKLPRTLLVGIGERGSRGGGIYAQVLELPEAA
jgi:hypothetical protein